MTRSMSFAPIAFAKSSTRFRMSVSVTSSCVFLHVPERETPFDSARNPAEINGPLLEGDVDGGEREIRRDKQKKKDPDRDGPGERTGFGEPRIREPPVGWPQGPRCDDEHQEHQRW